MASDDTDYFYERAERELEMAQRSAVPEAVRAHYVIANHYLDRVFGGAASAGGVPEQGISSAG